MPVVPLKWEQDLLPEYLWIVRLASYYGEGKWFPLYTRVLDTFDSSVDPKSTLLGLVSDFALIPTEQRASLLAAHDDLLLDAVHKPFGGILTLYPDCPMAWIFREGWLEYGHVRSRDKTVESLRQLVVTMFDPDTDNIRHLRGVPLCRALKHRRLALPSTLDVVEMMPRYPNGCTAEERREVQQFAKMTLNTLFMTDPRFSEHTWAKAFWRANASLAPCLVRDYETSGAVALSPKQQEALPTILTKNAAAARAWVQDLAASAVIDLYSPTKDEILLGLGARLARLFVLMQEEPGLWAGDTSGIMLRCLTDVAITFAYLSQHGTSEEFEAFRKYGEGKEKALMLHLQDTYPGEASLDGESATQISERLGGFAVELMDMELGGWTKKSVRDLSFKSGMERFYRLVFSPASEELHSTWTGLRKSSLRFCMEPLHRFHRLPAMAEPPFLLHVAGAAIEVFEHCVAIGTSACRFPPIRLEQLPKEWFEPPQDATDSASGVDPSRS